MTASTSPTSSAAGVAWDLHDLYAAADDPRLGPGLQAALQRAQAFEAAHRGKIAALQPDQAETLARTVTELEGRYEQMDRPAVERR